MTRIVYLNHKFLPLKQAKISMLDRGFLFGDGVYEVIPVLNGKPFHLREHLKRLQQSLRAIKCKFNLDYAKFEKNILKLLRLNWANQGDYSVYLQITRGVDTDRNRNLPPHLKPTIFMLIKPVAPLSDQELKKGKCAVTAVDIRWQYCHIKSISLLPTLLLVDKAMRANCEETILIRDDKVLEGTSSNVFVVKNNKVFTPLLSVNNLSGITRDLIMKLARKNKISIIEKNISKKFLQSADEIWITSSTRGIYPIVKLDGKKVGKGAVGKIWEKMIEIYFDYRKRYAKRSVSNTSNR